MFVWKLDLAWGCFLWALWWSAQPSAWIWVECWKAFWRTNTGVHFQHFLAGHFAEFSSHISSFLQFCSGDICFFSVFFWWLRRGESNNLKGYVYRESIIRYFVLSVGSGCRMFAHLSIGGMRRPKSGGYWVWPKVTTYIYILYRYTIMHNIPVIIVIIIIIIIIIVTITTYYNYHHYYISSLCNIHTSTFT